MITEKMLMQVDIFFTDASEDFILWVSLTNKITH